MAEPRFSGIKSDEEILSPSVNGDYFTTLERFTKIGGEWESEIISPKFYLQYSTIQKVHLHANPNCLDLWQLWHKPPE